MPRLKEWHTQGIQLAIFSSGSVAAQKLLFQHVGTENNDATGQIEEGKPESVGDDELACTSSRKRKHDPEGSHESSNKMVRRDGEWGCGNEDRKETLKKAEQAEGAENKRNEHKQEGAEVKSGKKEEVPEEKAEELNLLEKPKSSVDLTYLFSGFFDTVNAGPKTEKESYIKIAAELGRKAEEVLFLSDNVLGTISAFRLFRQRLVSFQFATWSIMFTLL